MNSILLRRRALMSMNTKRLPLSFQEIAWIESSGTQWIDTGIYPNQSDVFRCTLQSGNPSEAQACGIGYIKSKDYNNSRVAFRLLPTKIAFALGIGDYSFASEPDGQKHTIIIDIQNSRGILDNREVVTAADANFQYQKERRLPLFSQFSNSSYTCYKLRIYDFLCMRNGTAIQHLIPCFRKADGVAGMYDLVSRSFFMNSGTGDFIKGPTVTA